MMIWYVTPSFIYKELYVNGKRIPEPFCLIDMGIKSGTEIDVRVKEGAEIGLKKLEEQVRKELEAQQSSEL